MPVRIQLSRAKGWRKPPDVVIVSRPSRWGNPFIPAPMPVQGGNRVWRRNEEFRRRKEAVDLYRLWVEEARGAISVADVRSELRGRSLACWCPLPKPGEPDICHAAVLMEIANR